MTRGAPRTSPTRTCVGCGQRDAQAAMIRLRRDRAGAVNATGRSGTGRSAYVHTRPECVHGLMRSKGLGRSLRATLTKEERLGLMQALEGHLASEALTMPQMQRRERTEA